MSPLISIKKIFTQLTLIVFVGLLIVPNVNAKVYSGFSQPYGLIVHNLNKDREVPRIKALGVLLQYFETKPSVNKNVTINFQDINKDTTTYNNVVKACQLQLLDCTRPYFNPNEGVSQKDMLIWFYKLKYANEPDYLEKKYPNITDQHLRLWVEARRFNLLSDTKVTYKVLQELLYREKVVEANLNQSYKTGLIIDSKEINIDSYHSPRDIANLKNNLTQVINNLQEKGVLTVKERVYLQNTEANLQAVYNLEKSLKEKPYVLRKHPYFSQAVVDAVKNYDLQDVLYAHSYDYSKNAAYRKHNVTTGIKKVDGKVFLPGEILDYWKVMLSGNGLKNFRYGWVIDGGVEKWQFGGGICGSSTSVFIASWKAGLEIVERRHHTKYYSYLYPTKDLGLDATVYRPSPNLKIKNNMSQPIVYAVHDDTQKQVITVYVIGNSDYKNIKIEGPIYTNKRKVKWVRQFEGFDGNIKSETLSSHYDSVF